MLTETLEVWECEGCRVEVASKLATVQVPNLRPNLRPIPDLRCGEVASKLATVQVLTLSLTLTRTRTRTRTRTLSLTHTLTLNPTVQVDACTGLELS